MKLAIVGLVLVFAVSALAQDNTHETLSARDYFNELKAANSFTHYSDTYVCFRDDDIPSFAVVARRSDVLDEMKKTGHTPDKSVIQAKNFLTVETYFKGVSNRTQLFDPVGKEGTDWDTEFLKPIHGRMVYSINWATGRYRMRMYALDYNKTLPADETSGKCELIHPGA